MCDSSNGGFNDTGKTIPVEESVGTVLAHDITEIRPGEFKGTAFRKGHVIRREDICHLQRLGKEHLFVLDIGSEEMHEDDAALAIARALSGRGVRIKGSPREGKVSIVAERDGLLKIDRDALVSFNMLGDVMCATLHDNTVVTKGRVVAGTRAIPLVVSKTVIEEAVSIGEAARQPDGENRKSGIIEVKKMQKPRAGVVITGNEVYYGKVKDAFAPVIAGKIAAFGGEIVGTYYAPDDVKFIEDRLRELLRAGANLLVTTGGMSVDPDDVTRYAIRNLGAEGITYGSAVLPGAMFLMAYLRNGSPRRSHSSQDVPVIGIPACGMYSSVTVFDLVLPRILAGERIGRKDLSELGHGGLCMKCDTCRYPLCPFGKS